MPELRKDPITARWVIISTERGRRPMDFVRESVVIAGPRGCPFCPGAENKTPPEILAYGRNGGGANSSGWSIRVVPNRFPALGIEGNLNRQAEGMFDKMNGLGAHEVIIETPDHNATLEQLPDKRIEDVDFGKHGAQVDCDGVRIHLPLDALAFDPDCGLVPDQDVIGAIGFLQRQSAARRREPFHNRFERADGEAGGLWSAVG